MVIVPTVASAIKPSTARIFPVSNIENSIANNDKDLLLKINNVKKGSHSGAGVGTFFALLNFFSLKFFPKQVDKL